MNGNSNDETNLPNKLLLTDTQAFTNGSSSKITFPKTQPSNIMQLEQFIYDLLNFSFDTAETMFDSIQKVQDLVKKCQMIIL